MPSKSSPDTAHDFACHYLLIRCPRCVGAPPGPQREPANDNDRCHQHQTAGQLLELIEEVRARVSRETGRAVEVISCYEAGYDGFWLHRQLSAHGISNYVIDPASLQVDRRARRVKTDRIDTERLLRSLMAYLRGELTVWSVMRLPRR